MLESHGTYGELDEKIKYFIWVLHICICRKKSTEYFDKLWLTIIHHMCNDFKAIIAIYLNRR